MALEERRTLKEICLLVDRGSINVLWADEIVKDGLVIHSADHRGAYPVNESGDVDPSVAGLLGGTLEQIIGNIANQLQQNLASIQGQYAAVVHERDDLVLQLQQANIEIQSLADQLNAVAPQLQAPESPNAGTE